MFTVKEAEIENQNKEKTKTSEKKKKEMLNIEEWIKLQKFKTVICENKNMILC